MAIVGNDTLSHVPNHRIVNVISVPKDAGHSVCARVRTITYDTDELVVLARVGVTVSPKRRWTGRTSAAGTTRSVCPTVKIMIAVNDITFRLIRAKVSREVIR